MLSFPRSLALSFAIGFGLRWVAFTLVILLISRFADLTVPERTTLLRQTAAIALAVTLLAAIPWVGWILGLAAIGVLMKRWFDADLVAVIYVVLLSSFAMWGISIAVVTALRA